MKKILLMNLIWFLIFLNFSCQSRTDCLMDTSDFVLIYDEESCISCREKAKDFLQKNFEYYRDVHVVVINAKSKKKVRNEFKKINDGKVQFLAKNDAICLNGFPSVALLQRTNKRLSMVRDFN